MARTVQDAALILSAVAGPDPRTPIALTDPGEVFQRSLGRDFKDVRIAWSRDLGGLPVDPRVTRAIDGHRHVFESLGCITEDGEPDFTDADEVFQILRAWTLEMNYGDLFDTPGNREQMKETAIWNIEEGIHLSGPQIGRAERKRTELYHRVREFMNTYEFLILPVNQVPPFDVSQRYINEINGQEMATYIDWMRSCYYISATGHPAISVPCGFTPEGLPVGVQIVGRHQDDWGVLQLARAFEQATGYGRQRPAVTGPEDR